MRSTPTGRLIHAACIESIHSHSKTKKGSELRVTYWLLFFICATGGTALASDEASLCNGVEAQMSREHNVLALLLIVPLSGCSNAPSIPVLGAYFPDWLFCILAGMLLAFVLQALLARSGYAAWLVPSVLTYPVLAALLSMSTWLLFFQN